jgi:hypothetical protein
VYAGEVGLVLRKRSDVSLTTTGSALRLGLLRGEQFSLAAGLDLFVPLGKPERSYCKCNVLHNV